MHFYGREVKFRLDLMAGAAGLSGIITGETVELGGDGFCPGLQV